MRTSLVLPCLLLLAPFPGLGISLAQDRPEVVLELSAPKTGLVPGEKVALALKLDRKKGKATEVNALRLARNSISLKVTAGGATRIVTRIYGSVAAKGDGQFVVTDIPSPMVELKRGKPLTAEVPFIALLPGENRVRALYTGLGEEAPPLESGEVVLSVETGRDGAKLGAVIETSEGPLTFTLWPERAYNTVFNFLALAAEGRYDNLSFHRIIRGSLIQGGDPKGDGTGGPGWTIPGEFDPAAKHERGVISMARSRAVDSAGSQFFVMHAPMPDLDGNYAAFGILVDGTEALELIATADVTVRSGTNPPEKSRPIDPPVIRTVRPILR
jgi:peptidyl-prolyl cis-trans isomerase B (cyclophilin B)